MFFFQVMCIVLLGAALLLFNCNLIFNHFKHEKQLASLPEEFYLIETRLNYSENQNIILIQKLSIIIATFIQKNSLDDELKKNESEDIVLLGISFWNSFPEDVKEQFDENIFEKLIIECEKIQNFFEKFVKEKNYHLYYEQFRNLKILFISNIFVKHVINSPFMMSYFFHTEIQEKNYQYIKNLCNTSYFKSDIIYDSIQFHKLSSLINCIQRQTPDLNTITQNIFLIFLIDFDDFLANLILEKKCNLFQIYKCILTFLSVDNNKIKNFIINNKHKEFLLFVRVIFDFNTVIRILNFELDYNEVEIVKNNEAAFHEMFGYFNQYIEKFINFLKITVKIENIKQIHENYKFIYNQLNNFSNTNLIVIEKFQEKNYKNLVHVSNEYIELLKFLQIKTIKNTIIIPEVIFIYMIM